MDLTTVAKEIIDNGYAYVGVRSLCDDEQYEVGDNCRESYEWDFENDCSTYQTTGEFADGTCATAVRIPYYTDDDTVKEIVAEIEKAIALNKGYGGSRQVIIAGHQQNSDAALDDGEIRIIDAKVIGVLDKE